MPRAFTVALIALAVVQLGSLAGGSGVQAKPADDTPRECLGSLRSVLVRSGSTYDPAELDIVIDRTTPGDYRGASGVDEFLEALPGLREGDCKLPIPGTFADGIGTCIDFDSSNDCIQDADDDGWTNHAEERLGSDPHDADSTPESALLDEQTGSQTCSDRADNEADGRTDRSDAGCRLTCRDFSAGWDSRCRDGDGDSWLNYVEELHGSEPDDAASTPEHVLVGETCDDGVDNDGDGDTDGDDAGCGGGEVEECIDFSEDFPCAPF